MDSWMMLSEGGQELCSGLQLPAEKARDAAQRRANDIGAPIELVKHGERNGEWFDPEVLEP